MFGSSQGLGLRPRWCTKAKRAFALGALLWVSLLGSSAWAEEDAQVRATRAAAARALFNEARELMQSGHPEKACPKLEESLRLEPGLGTRFNLADCWQAIERTASAWSLFLDVAAEARANGQTDRAEVAAGRANALEPQLSYLIVSVPRPQEGQRVWLGKVELGRGAWGSRWPVDKGAHELRTEAPGFDASYQTVRIASLSEVINVTLQPLKPKPPATPEPTVRKPAPTSDTDERAEAPVPPPERDSGLARAIGIPTLLVLGLAGGGLGTYFIIDRNNLNAEAESLCLDLSCSLEERNAHTRLINDAKTAETTGVVSFAVGGACLVGAALWYFLGREEEPLDSVSVNLVDGLSVSYRRTF